MAWLCANLKRLKSRERLRSDMNRRQKIATYERVMQEIEATLAGETDLLVAMVTMVSPLHQAFDTYFWTGFYRRVGPDRLLIGPYQGTLGCLNITFDRGVCGACARNQRTVIVPDVHQP
jgi:L-methionine (R)-S-oxide reductase